MKAVLKTLICLFLLSFSEEALSQGNILNVLKIKNSDELKAYFKYTGNDIPIISGHRGGIVKNYPENCIPTFEHILKSTPAFFEIDPRLTKDSLVVLMHDATLDRTTNGSGKVSDYTYAQLSELRLKDAEGHITNYRIPLLSEVIKWSKGKTVLNLDRKDVPLELTDKIIREAGNEVIMLTVHSPEQARFYLERNPEAMFSAHILNRKTFDEYEQAGIPWQNMIAYIGPRHRPENKELLDLLHARGVMCMISAAPSHDKLKDSAERAENYRETFRLGADILESDLPAEVATAIQGMVNSRSPKRKYQGIARIK
jgi:glycerophosphoryl diester phosphodiesterase